MRRRTFVAAGGASAAALALVAFAQDRKPVPRVSFVSHSTAKAYGRAAI